MQMCHFTISDTEEAEESYDCEQSVGVELVAGYPICFIAGVCLGVIVIRSVFKLIHTFVNHIDVCTLSAWGFHLHYSLVFATLEYKPIIINI